MPLEYKVIELSTVTDEEIQSVLNDWTAQGWKFEGLHFAMRESSRRPSMAFVMFTRENAKGGPD
ncbi:MAG: DUF4177 domain-containing protein [Planctomycetota bacterium]